MTAHRDQALSEIVENQLVTELVRALPRARSSRNATHETDAELVEIGLPDTLLAATVDCVAEEIAHGIYPDPFLQGWVGVVASLSDLAAVGATPLGMLMAVSLPRDFEAEQRARLLAGIGEALAAHNVGSLGGDTGTGPVALTATALGLVARERVMRRVGAAPGDRVYTTGHAGVGAFAAFAALVMPQWAGRLDFRPRGRLQEGSLIAPLASSCMDTSDGLMFTVDQLARLNSVSIELESANVFVHPVVAQSLAEIGVPALAAAAAVHGDFELCFTLPESRERELFALADTCAFRPLRVGRVVELRPEAHVWQDGRPIDTTAMRNLAAEVSSVSDYAAQLVTLLTTKQGLV